MREHKAVASVDHCGVESSPTLTPEYRRELLRVACTLLLASRSESRVELNDALRNMAIQRQGEEDLFRYSLMNKPPDVLEPKAPVVLRMSHEAASPGTKVLQT